MQALSAIAACFALLLSQSTFDVVMHVLWQGQGPLTSFGSEQRVFTDFATATSNLLRCSAAQSVQAQLNDREHTLCIKLVQATQFADMKQHLLPLIACCCCCSLSAVWQHAA